jgi:hypothetical protein
MICAGSAEIDSTGWDTFGKPADNPCHAQGSCVQLSDIRFSCLPCGSARALSDAPIRQLIDGGFVRIILSISR